MISNDQSSVESKEVLQPWANSLDQTRENIVLINDGPRKSLAHKLTTESQEEGD